MKNRVWLKEEIAVLEAKAGKLSHKQIAKLLGRSSQGVAQKMWHLKLQAKRGFRFWKKEELTLIEKEFDPENRVASLRQLGARLGRSRSSIANQLRRMECWESRSPHTPWSKEELRTLMWGCEHLSNKELAKKLGRTYISVKFKMYQLGYKPLCGVYSMHSLIRETGYSEYQILRAKKNLKQPWHKTRSNRYAIRPSQAKEICEYLRDEGKNEFRVVEKTVVAGSSAQTYPSRCG